MKVKSNWTIISNQIIEYIGGINNFDQWLHCATRLRLHIINSELIDKEKLKTIPEIKGIMFTGDQLQLVIGPNVAKVFLEFNQVVINLKNNTQQIEIKQSTTKHAPKPSLTARTFAALQGIMAPLLPLFIVSGLLVGMEMFLSIVSGNPNYWAALEQGSPTWLIMFHTLAQTGFMMMGVLILWSTVKYMGGQKHQEVVALLLGLILISPIIWIYPADNPILIDVPLFDVSFKPYNNSVFVFWILGVIYFLFDKWVQKWMPATVDLIFRPLLTVTFCWVITIFAIGPIMLIIEHTLGWAFSSMLNFAVGIFIFSFFWQPMVATGTQGTVSGVMSLQLIDGNPNTTTLFFATTQFAAMTQTGVTVGIGLSAKDKKLKRDCYTAAIPGIFGVTEPQVYGVNVARPKAFFIGCFVAGIMGVLALIFNMETSNQSGWGIMGFLAYDHNIGLKYTEFFVLLFISFVISATLVFFFYDESKNPANEVNKVNKLIVNYDFIKPNKSFNKILATTINDFNHFINTYKPLFKDLRHNIIATNNIKYQIQLIEDEVIMLNDQSKPNKKRINKLLKQKQHYEQLLININIKFAELNLKYHEYIILSTNELDRHLEKLSAITTKDYSQFKNYYLNALNIIYIQNNIDKKLEFIIPKEYTKEKFMDKAKETKGYKKQNQGGEYHE